MVSRRVVAVCVAGTPCLCALAGCFLVESFPPLADGAASGALADGDAPGAVADAGASGPLPETRASGVLADNGAFRALANGAYRSGSLDAAENQPADSAAEDGTAAADGDAMAHGDDSSFDSPEPCHPSMPPTAPDGALLAACDSSQPFSAPVEVASLSYLCGGVGTTCSRWTRFSGDGRTAYYEWGTSLYSATLSGGADAAFEAPVAIIPAVTLSDGAEVVDEAPTITPDGTTLYFDSTRTGDHYEIWSSTRASPADPFGPPQLVASLYDPNFDSRGTFVQGDGSYLYFVSNRAPSPDMEVYRARLTGPGQLGPAERLPEFVGLYALGITLTPDGLKAYLSIVDSASGHYQLFSTQRPCSSLPFDPPAIVRELYFANANSDVSWITSDGCTLYFSSFRSGDGSGTYEATRAANGGS
jgi:hypothetical protein